MSTGRPSFRSYLIVLTIVFLAGAGALLVGVFLPPVAAAWHARSWVRVRCTIDEAGVAEQRDSEGKISYSAHVRYRYALDGTQYVGRRISFLEASHATRRRAQTETAGMGPGTAVPCFVDPTSPRDAVLDRGLGRLTGWIAAPLVWIALMVVAVVALARRRPPGAAGATDA